VDDETLFEFYDQRISHDVISARHFDSWWKQASKEMLQLFDFRPQLQVLPEEGVARLPVALHQRVADKQRVRSTTARSIRRCAASCLSATRWWRATGKRATPRRHHRALRPLPVRLAI
jgi:HrpA-like RNA helicase